MRTAGLLLCYVVGVFVGGALLAPWLFQLAQLAGGEFPAFATLASQPFHRFVNRSLLVAALIALWPLLRALKLTDRRALGFVGPLPVVPQLFRGLALGFGSLFAAAVLMGVLGVRTFNFNHAAPVLVKLALSAGLSAVVVALLEEFLFRGAIFGALRRDWSLWPALVVSGALYSWVHFFARVEHAGPVDWASGLGLLLRMADGMGASAVLIPAGLSLLVGGVALGLAYERTGSLWFSIGLHAGWVFWLKVFKTVTAPVERAGGALWGTDRLLDGWLACFIMLAVLAVVACLPRTPQTPAVPHEPASESPRA